MARISTGQTYGETDRQTSQRLLGGEEQVASGGAIAQRSINAPFIQPTASPVNTFQQSGAPTLGGPVRMFAPPDIPAPNQDLANLARALGGFSDTLGKFGDAYIAKLKADDEQAKVKGTAAAAQLSVRNPAMELSQLRDALEKKALAGDQQAARDLALFRALSPLELGYANRYMDKVLTSQSLATAVDRWKMTPQVVDANGQRVDREMISPFDQQSYSLVRNAQLGIIRMPTDPVVSAELQPQILEAQRQMDREQLDRYNDRQQRMSDAATQAVVTNAFVGKVQVNGVPAIDATAAATEISTMLTDRRLSTGIEQYQKTVSQLPEYLRKAALMGSIDPNTGKPDINLYRHNMQAAMEIYGRIQAGPNGETLEAWMGAKGGMSGRLELMNGLMQDFRNMKQNVDSMSSAAGEEVSNDVIQQFGLNDPNVLANQVLLDQRTGMAFMWINQNIADPVARREATERVQRTINEGRFAFTEPEQRAASREALQRQGNILADPAEEKRWLEAQVASGRMNPETAKGYQSWWNQLQKEELAPIKKAAQDEITKALQQFSNGKNGAFELPGSPGGMTLTQDERATLMQLRTAMSNQVQGIIRNGIVKGLDTGVIQQQVVEAMTDPKWRPQVQKPGDEKPVYPNGPGQWKSGLGFFGQFGRGDTAANQQLNADVRQRRLFKEDDFLKHAQEFLDTGKVDPDLKFMIDRAGYRQNPAEFFRQQWRQYFPNDPWPDARGREMNNQSSAAPQSTSPVASMYQPSLAVATAGAAVSGRLGAMIRNMAVNAIAPPAAAAEFPSAAAVAVRGPVNINRLRQAIVGKESGGNFGAVNPDSGALGIGQVMPENVGPWTQKHFGRRLTPKQFLANKEAQLAVVNGQMNEILQQQLKAGYDTATAIRRTASIWYSGQGNLYNDPRPQYSKGRRYPSIREYTLDILSRYTRS